MSGSRQMIVNLPNKRNSHSHCKIDPKLPQIKTMLNKGKNMGSYRSFTYVTLIMKFLQRKQTPNLYYSAQYYVVHPSQCALPL